MRNVAGQFIEIFLIPTFYLYWILFEYDPIWPNFDNTSSCMLVDFFALYLRCACAAGKTQPKVQKLIVEYGF